MRKKQLELVEAINNYFGVDAAYFDVDAFTLAKHIMEAGWTKQEWIPVTERLPEKNTTVLGYYEFGRNIFWYDEKGFNDIDEYGVACPNDTVTYWIPLPEPPKEDDQ
jgi:hypothetical protein